MIEQDLTPADDPAPDRQELQVRSVRPRLRPGNTLVAAASRITSEKLKGSRMKRSLAQGWQDEAWDLFDLVGEQRFLATTLAGRLSQARLYVGKIPDDSTERPIPLEADKANGNDATAFAVLNSFAGGSPTQAAQLIARLGVNLFVAGDGWLVGIPHDLLYRSEVTSDGAGINPFLRPQNGPDPSNPAESFAEGIDLDSLEWRMLSVNEVAFEDDHVVLKTGETDRDSVTASPDDVFLIRVWRPHPRYWWQAESPTRASLPVLRELVGLTMHISAQVDSRLAGAGVFLVPQTAADAIRRSNDTEDTEDDDTSPFTEALIDAMTEPINDRSSASAIVPLVVEVPDDTIEKFRLITFANELDAEARELRDEAIRRLALGQDAPPEILLGTGGMNHWGAWLVREDTITTHIEPPLALICDALTTQFLRPILVQQGMDEDAADDYVIWYDVDHLIMRPNRSTDAAALYQAGAISAASYRDAAGFGDQDAPPAVAQTDPAVAKALDLITAAPSLAQDPGIAALVEQIRAVMSGSGEEVGQEQPVDPSQGDTPADDETPDVEGNGDGPPDNGGDTDLPPGEDDLAASAHPPLAINWDPPLPAPPEPAEEIRRVRRETLGLNRIRVSHR